jgi:hypothetical protein
MEMCAIAWVILTANLAAAGGPAAPRPPETLVPPVWDRFSADLTITQGRVTADGAPTAHVATPRTVVHVVRTLEGGVWRTTFEVRERGPIGDGRVKERPQDVFVRIEDPGDGSPLKIFDANGVQRHIPGAAELASMASRIGIPEDRLPKATADAPPQGARGRPRSAPGLDRLVPLKGHAAARRRALDDGAGPSRGTVRGLDRYLMQRGERVIEQLVDPALALPVETNTVDHGELVAHTTFGYQAYGRDRVLRNTTRVEQRIPGTTDRSVIEMRLDNVLFDRTGGAK